MRFISFLIIMALASCTNEVDLCAEKFSKLDALEKTTKADLFRKRSECQATAIEFDNDREMISMCMESYRIYEDMAKIILENISKRKEEKDMILCKYIDAAEIFGVK